MNQYMETMGVKISMESCMHFHDFRIGVINPGLDHLQTSTFFWYKSLRGLWPIKDLRTFVLEESQD